MEHPASIVPVIMSEKNDKIAKSQQKMKIVTDLGLSTLIEK